jgi:hypothetical protein
MVLDEIGGLRLVPIYAPNLDTGYFDELEYLEIVFKAWLAANSSSRTSLS